MHVSGDDGMGSALSSSFFNELQSWFNATTAEERLKSGKRFEVGTTSEALKSIHKL